MTRYSGEITVYPIKALQIVLILARLKECYKQGKPIIILHEMFLEGALDFHPVWVACVQKCPIYEISTVSQCFEIDWNRILK